MQIVQSFTHQPERFFHQFVYRAGELLFEYIDRKHRHDPAYNNHVVSQRRYLPWQELVLKAHLVHHISNHPGK
jgi:hypothetical protein